MAIWGNSGSDSTQQQSYTTPPGTTPTSGQTAGGGSGWGSEATFRRNTRRQQQRRYSGQTGMRPDGEQPATAGGPSVKGPAAVTTQPATSVSGVNPDGTPSQTQQVAASGGGAGGASTGSAPLPPGSPGAGWFQGADGGWLPPDRAPAGGAGVTAGGTSNRPDPAAYSPYGAYPGRDASTEYNPEFLDGPIAEYDAPDNLGAEAGMWDALQSALSTAPINRNAMKERSKEQLIAARQQNLDSIGQDLASRGVTQSGDVRERATREAMDQALLEEYRGVDQYADEADLNRKLSVTNAIESALGGSVDRAGSNLSNTLASYGYNREGDVYDNTLREGVANNRIANYGLDTGAFFQNKELDLSKWMAENGFNIDWAKLKEGGEQFDASYLLDVANFLERNKQWQGGMDFNYAGLNSGLAKTYVAGAGGRV
jgi:hypothetical protein